MQICRYTRFCTDDDCRMEVFCRGALRDLRFASLPGGRNEFLEGFQSGQVSSTIAIMLSDPTGTPMKMHNRQVRFWNTEETSSQSSELSTIVVSNSSSYPSVLSEWAFILLKG